MTDNPKPIDPDDEVDQAGVDSFPASDPPSYTPPTAQGPPESEGSQAPLPAETLEPVREHPISDPCSRFDPAKA